MRAIPYGRQTIDDADIQEVIKVLRSGWITQGPMVARFEDALCAYTKAKYAVCVSSGTAALHLACLALGIRAKDEVITSPLTFVASANCVLYCQGVPVFSDIIAETGNIDPDKIEAKITKRTKAIIPVHFAGQPCALRKIRALAKKYNLSVIEDAAHALGAEYFKSKIGACTFSDMTILSFHPVKHITTGEGGAILTNNKDIYHKLARLRSHGIVKNIKDTDKTTPWYYEMIDLGFNYRITDFQCALGLSQLRKLERFIQKRKILANKYNKAFLGNPFFDIPQTTINTKSSWHLYPLRLKDKLTERKIELFASLQKKGIKCQVHYIPVYRHPYYQRLGYGRALCPVADKFYEKELSIPLFPLMTDKEQRYVIDNLLNISKRIGG